MPGVETALRDRGLRVTPQRLAIHRTLVELDRHVSAEQVMRALGERLPGVSLPTVYATLDLFCEMGLVRRIAARDDAVLYDPRSAPHHHVTCVSCGKVEDLDADVDLTRAQRTARRHGFAVQDVELVVRGRCRECAGAAQSAAP
jgi:Fe2+ or Zn2+ uptake regulation protein